MDLFMEGTKWPEALQPLIDKYKGERHPLHYENIYQLLVMVVLSAQDSDAHINKIAWLQDIADTIKEDKNIPVTMKELVALKGVGRKSANVIMREAGKKAEGILVDLHVVRVAPRLGIAKGKDATKIEKEMMAVLPQDMWGEIGMAISFLGRDTCRPSNPKHSECIMKNHCEFYKEHTKTGN